MMTMKANMIRLSHCNHFTSMSQVISSKQTGIIAGVALNDSSTIQSWMGVAPIIATSIFQGSGNESCVDSLQISR